jgi:transposase InsO family protein
MEAGLSMRRACAWAGIHRSSFSYEPREDRNAEVRVKLKELAKPEEGCRQAYAMLKREIPGVSIKRVHRLWKDGRLQLKNRKTRRRVKTGRTVPMKAEHPGHVWCLDFCFDSCLNGQKMKVPAVVNEFTRECLVLEAGSRMSDSGVIRVLMKAFAENGAPQFLRSDNGPELICEVLRIWLRVQDCQSKFIEPGSPWQTGHAESFNSQLRAEMLDAEVFASLADAQMKILLWRRFYNEERPYSSLGYSTPYESAARFRDSCRASPSLHLENRQLTTRGN